jgi:hypothetical protein
MAKRKVGVALILEGHEGDEPVIKAANASTTRFVMVNLLYPPVRVHRFCHGAGSRVAGGRRREW